ncbi:hypothetical protein M501DRAFT_1003701 [Patellaria atrata CBS 101060]|uniref:Heterokaryon incompatibility domain-containing protein n=1 Tax=Patellaria atrata CBS 101060 TaxID=1346257 RepID=A0A9P4VMX8_9PEZI|nr:hypothetical protein M501DRAFT_1003701 [Patellaria atrata CBS 101060]
MDATSEPHYHALGVDEIRVLKLQPGQEDDKIVVHLIHVRLSDNPEYEALSYVWRNSIEPDHAIDMEVEVQVTPLMPHAVDDMEWIRNNVMKMKFRELAHHPTHSFLYYSRGGERFPERISCDGSDIMIGGELHFALKNLRRATKSRTLWADALCINQSDPLERGEQVKLMASIYARATQVVIWLGGSYMEVEHAAMTLSGIRFRLASHIFHHDNKPTTAQMYELSQDPEWKAQHWDSIAELMRRNWFGRVWCLQEAVNAKKAVMQIGDKTIEMESLLDTIYRLYVFGLDTPLWSKGRPTGLLAVRTIYGLRASEESQRPSMLELLHHTRTFKCTFPSDKFYGLLNLVSDNETNGVVIDYTKDPSEVFIDFAVHDMLRKKYPVILHFCVRSNEKSELNLPSWVPDWTQHVWQESVTYNKYFNLGTYNASRDRAPHFSFSEDRRILFIEGIILDIIEEVELLRAIPPRERPKNVFRGDKDKPFWDIDAPETEKPWHIRDTDNKPFWESSHESFLDEYLSNRRTWVKNAISIAFPEKSCTPEQYEALWRTFLWDLAEQRERPGPEYEEYFSLWFQDVNNKTHISANFRKEKDAPGLDLRRLPGDAIEVDEEGRMSLMFAKAHEKCDNRRFYRTSGGRYGWAPDTTRSGDLVAVLHGLEAPFILRAAEDGRYVIVGDAYLHGVMYGAALDMGLEMQTLEIV